MYLPTIYKPDGKGKLPRIDESTLVQLIHRAGRDNRNIPTATVYCSIQDYEYIHNLLFNDPRGNPEEPSTGIPEISIETLKSLEEISLEFKNDKIVESYTNLHFFS